MLFRSPTAHEPNELFLMEFHVLEDDSVGADIVSAHTQGDIKYILVEDWEGWED